VEVLNPVRRAHHDDLIRFREAVELDEELVQRLVLLAVEAVSRSGGTDGIELVDEDNRGRMLARLLEEAADPRGAEAGEHLDERGRALRVEGGARLPRAGLREQRLAGSRRAVEEDSLRNARAEALELLRVAQEVDDLLELRLRLLRTGHVGPGHVRAGVGLHGRGLDARHHLPRAPAPVAA